MCEYWPLEQAKLGVRKEPPLAGQIAVVTGAARRHRRSDARRCSPPPARKSRCSTSNLAAPREKAEAIGPTALPVRMRRDRRRVGACGLR